MSHARASRLLKSALWVTGGAVIGGGIGAGLAWSTSGSYAIISTTYAGLGVVATGSSDYAHMLPESRLKRRLEYLSLGAFFGLLFGATSAAVISAMWQATDARGGLNTGDDEGCLLDAPEKRNMCRPYSCLDNIYEHALNDKVTAHCKWIGEQTLKIITPVTTGLTGLIGLFKARCIIRDRAVVPVLAPAPPPPAPAAALPLAAMAAPVVPAIPATPEMKIIIIPGGLNIDTEDTPRSVMGRQG